MQNTPGIFTKGLSAFVIAGAFMGSIASSGALDLTTAGASGFINGGYFVQVPDQTTGTGVIEPFVRIQANGTEEGYNTDLKPMKDVKTGIWTHEITLAEIPVVKLGGIDYYEFLLDINQNQGQDHEILSLNELEIYTKTGPLASADEYSDLAAATKVWDMDALADETITLDYSLNAGSGSGDMKAYIPVSAIGNDGTKNLYLYSKFGDPHQSNDGFEEWAVIKAPTTTSVPDGGSTLALMGSGIAAIGFFARRLKTVSSRT